MKKKYAAILTGLLLCAGSLLAGCTAGQGAQDTSADTQTETQTAEAETAEVTEAGTDVSEIGSLPEETAETEDTQQDVAETQEETPDTVAVYGTVQEILENGIHIANDDESDPYREIVLNITEDTLIVDAVEGSLKTLADIKDGESIHAYTSMAMTRSLPPISNAAVIFCNIPADYAAPEYASILKIEEQDDHLVLTMDRNIYYHVGDQTPIADFATGEEMKATDLKEGMRLISWYQIVLQSFPPQATPDKILVIR